MKAQGITSAKDRQTVRLALMRLAQRIGETPCEVAVTIDREPTELKPPDCPNDGYRHYRPGDKENWAVTIEWKPAVRAREVLAQGDHK